jgi:threonine dehydratase
MNFDRLRFVAERAALGEGREALLSVDIPERPGRYVTRAPVFCIGTPFTSPDWTTFSSFFALHTVIHPRAVTEFTYRYNSPDRAHVFLSFQLETNSRATEVETVLAELRRDGMNGYDISDDELAKSHARYMIGGASDAPNERIFRFGGCAFQIPPTLPPSSCLRHHRVSISLSHYPCKQS